MRDRGKIPRKGRWGLDLLDDRSIMVPENGSSGRLGMVTVEGRGLELMSKETTRDALREAGRRVFLERGYNNSGIDAILSEADVPKGSFYYYFPSKEEFGLQVLNRFAQRHEADLDRIFSDTTLRPLERLRRLVEV